MKMPHILTVAIALFVATPAFGISQDAESQSANSSTDFGSQPYVGIYGGLLFTTNSAELTDVLGTFQLPSDADPYAGNPGSGFGAGVLFGLPLSNGTYGVELGAGFISQSNELQTTDEKLIFVDDDNGGTTPTTGVFQHTLATEHSGISIKPSLWINPFGKARFSVGPQFTIVNSVTFEQSHEFLGDKTLVVPEQEGVYVVSEFPHASSMRTHLEFAAGWEVPIGESQLLSVEPQVTYSIALSENLDQETWQTSWFSGSAVLRYRFPASVDPLYDTLYQRDTTVVERYVAEGSVSLVETGSTLTFDEDNNVYVTTITESYQSIVAKPLPVLEVDVSAIGITQNQQQVPLENIALTEYVDVRYTPLLNYVFFDEDSSVLPSRYNQLQPQQISDFNLNGLHGTSTLGQYYHVLNIVGVRMQEYPDAALTITGCNADSRSEENNRELSKERAETVKEYLQRVWGISENRLQIATRNLPERESNRTKEEGMEENRRVELASSRSEILAPVFTSDTTWSSHFASIEFMPSVNSEAGVSSWNFKVISKGTEVFSESGEGALPARIRFSVVPEDLARVDDTDLEVHLGYQLAVSDELEQEGASEVAKITLSKNTMQDRMRSSSDAFSIENYALLLFEFNDVRLNNANLEIIDFIKSRMHERAELTIVGVTDSLGEAEWNTTLSRRRANAVADLFDSSSIEVVGAGEDTRTYPNELPEGRIYSRTVFITVRNPLD